MLCVESRPIRIALTGKRNLHEIIVKIKNVGQIYKTKQTADDECQWIAHANIHLHRTADAVSAHIIANSYVF